MEKCLLVYLLDNHSESIYVDLSNELSQLADSVSTELLTFESQPRLVRVLSDANQSEEDRSRVEAVLKSRALDGVVSRVLGPGTEALLIGVSGMTCQSCVKLIESTLSERDGVLDVTVSLERGEAFVQYKPDAISFGDIETTIYDMGFDTTKLMDHPLTAVQLERACPVTEEVPVEGMVCQSCVHTIQSALSDLPGMQSVTVSLERSSATVTLDSNKTTLADVVGAINELGFQATEVTSSRSVRSGEQPLNGGAMLERSRSVSPEVVARSHDGHVTLPCALNESEERAMLELHVSGMTCASCVANIEKSLLKYKGILQHVM